MVPALPFFHMWIKMDRCLARMKDPLLIDKTSPFKYKSIYKKEIKQR